MLGFDPVGSGGCRLSCLTTVGEHLQPTHGLHRTRSRRGLLSLPPAPPGTAGFCPAGFEISAPCFSSLWMQTRITRVAFVGLIVWMGLWTSSPLRLHKLTSPYNYKRDLRIRIVLQMNCPLVGKLQYLKQFQSRHKLFIVP